MRHRNKWTAVLLGLCSIAMFSDAQSQQPWDKKADHKSAEESGSIEAIASVGVQIKNAKSETWNLAVSPDSTVSVTGTAAPEYLKAGLTVKFTAEIDGTGAMQGEIEELEIFTPAGKNSLGLFATGGGDDAKPVKKLEAGTYDIKAKIASYKEGVLTVVAGGKKISGKVAAEPKIAVNLSDLSVAQVGDSVTAKIWYTDKTKAEAGKTIGKGMAEEITVTLANPLAPAKKGRAAKNASKEKKSSTSLDSK